MSAARDPRRDSWQLKLARAEHHMKELEDELGRYASRHPYEARRLDEGNSDPRHWKYVLHFTEQPGPSFRIILGDVLTNFRAALDHIAVALVPEAKRTKHNIFPLVADIGKFNANPTPQDIGKYQEGRKNFCRAVSGMAPDAVTVIEEYQPYHVAPFAVDGVTPQIHAMLALNRLVKDDKHKRLVPIATGLGRARSFAVHAPTGMLLNRGWYRDLHDPGAIVGDIDFPARIPPESEVEMHVSGTPRITTEVIQGYGNNDLMQMIRDVLTTLKTDVFPRLEPCIPE